MNALDSAPKASPMVRRIGALLLVTVALLASLFAGIHVASGTRHRGGNGPGFDVFPPPPSANFGGFPYGSVYLNGSPVTNAVVAMGYNGKEITTTVVSLPQFKDPLFMFDSRPARELTTTFGVTAIFTATVAGYDPVTTTVRLFPDQAGEVAVPLWIGLKPEIKPIPLPPASLLAADAMTNMVASHQMDAGDYHTCMIVTGQLRCWGWNNYLQAGVGDSSASNAIVGKPAIVTNITETVRAVALGRYHTCAALLSGRVQCFGFRDPYGATGTDDLNDGAVTSSTVDVQGIDNAVDVVAGVFSSCALVRDVQNRTRRVKCWGMNSSGQLGNGTVDFDPHPVPTYVLDQNGNPLENVTAIATKGVHVCAVVAGGVQCWGSLVEPGFGNRIAPTPQSVIPAGSGIIYVEMGVYSNTTCAVQVGGAVFCWGDLAIPHSALPMRFAELPADITKLAFGRYFGCALRAVGSVLCWGNWSQSSLFGVFGEMGVNGSVGISLPIPIIGITNAVDITAGETHVCVRLTDAGAKCWGTNERGQIGDDTYSSSIPPWFSPVTVTAMSQSATSVATGSIHTCAIADTGEVYCWGANNLGQLGTGYRNALNLGATAVVSLPAAARMLAAGNAHTCALLVNDSIYCWGGNSLGQLGNPYYTDSSVPVKVVGLDSGLQAISASDNYNCALRTDGELFCWGDNGLANVTDNATLVTGLAGRAIAVAAGSEHTCAVTEAGAIQCWGNNNQGQLGNGAFSTISISQPMTVTGLSSGATAVAAGRYHTCAIVSGSVKCWGMGAYGQLGNSMPLSPGGNYSASVPVDVVGFSGAVTDLQAGEYNTCARLASGETLCWGAGWLGLLGNGGINNSSTPITLTALSNSVTDLDIGITHLCVRLSSGGLRCWGGDDVYGQIGNGYSGLRPKPDKVVNVPPAKWTYMLYLAGDNDLSSYLDNVADALDRLPQSPDLNVAVFFDGQGEEDSYVWSTRDGMFNKWRIAEGESRTSDAATLSQFIDWAHASFPAEHYYLSIANHGRGTTGIAFDTQNGTLEKPEALTPAGLRQALAEATSNGLWQIDVLHFDACLMAMLEVAHQVKDYAHYMVASENLTAALYPYDKYAQAVLENPAVTPRQLAVGIADQYYDAPYMLLNNYPRTISVLDLSQIDGVIDALDTLASALTSNMAAVKADIAVARDLVQVFDASPDFTQTPSTYYTLTRVDEYVDLRHLAQLLRNSPNAAVNAAAQALYDLLDQSAANGFVVRSRSQPGVDRLVSGNTWDLSNSHGVAIYFPLAQNPADYPSYVSDSLFTFSAASQWDEFLKAYLSGTDATPLPDPGIPPIIQPMVPITTHCEGSQTCLWGTAYGDGLPLAGAVVSLAHANGSAQSTSAVVAQNEFYPIFRFPLDNLNVQPGDRLTLTAVYSATEVQRTLLFDLVNGEQEVNITLQSTAAITDPEQVPVPVAAGVRWAMVYPQTIDRGEVRFTAEGATSDGSPVVAYRWTSSLDGDLGTSSTFAVNSDRLQRGVHTIEVTAISDQGVESPPTTVVLTVTAPAPATLLFTPTQTVAVVGGEEVAIDVRVFDRFGAPVEDGTPVSATTTLGELVNPQAATVGGVATFVLRPPNQPGSAAVQVTAGDVSGVTSITFTSAAVATLQAKRGTARLPADGTSTTTVRVFAADRFGNPVPNLPVSFATDLGTIEPTVATNAFGWARATYTAASSVGIATITATAGDLAVQAQIFIGGEQLAGRVFADLNRNGVLDEGEPGLENVQVSAVATADPSGAAYTSSTAEDGMYAFAAVPLTEVMVRAVDRPGLTWTTPTSHTVFAGPDGAVAPPIGGAYLLMLPVIARGE